jgi:hypothetical protein
MRLTFHVSQFFKVLSLPFRGFKDEIVHEKLTLYQYIIIFRPCSATLVIVMSWDCHSLKGLAVVTRRQKGIIMICVFKVFYQI